VFGFLTSSILCICLLQGLGVNAHKQVSLVRAQIAADAAALAAATNGDAAAEKLAGENGAQLQSVRHFGDDQQFVEVIVAVNGMRALAVATDDW
jgi:hypothetical protein